MSYFGETLFGGGKFVRWTVSPFILLFAILMPFLIVERTPKAAVVLAGMELICVGLLVGFWLPSRFGRWAFRGVTGLVFLAYAGYLICEVFFSGAPFRLVERRSEPSPRNAVLGFVLIGLPCLWYTVFGRFTLRAPKPEQEIDRSDTELDDDV